MMRSRREFMSLAARAAAAGCVLRAGRPAAAESGGMTYGVQMYMLRRQAATDLAGALHAIRDAGFAQVELYPIAYTHPAAELRTMIADAGLACVSAHFDYVGLESRLDFGHALGLKYFVCPMLPHEQWNSLDGFRRAADLFNRVGQGAKERGMQFAFHNHDYEFKPIAGSNGWTELMSHTDAALVKLEFDCYWLTQAGQRPAEMLRRYRDRAVLMHMKDRTAKAPTSFDMGKDSEHFTELGTGTIDWPGLLKEAESQGIRCAFLDQDEVTGGMVAASMKKSREYLRTIEV